jgi:copper(I)-binding protein
MKRLVALIALALGTLTAAAAGPVTVQNPWIREAPPTASALAGYMVLVNPGDNPHTLVNTTSADFGNIMAHRTVVENGMARMIHAGKLEVPAHGKLTFAPGGYHLMLMQPKRALHAGDEVNITLEFADGSKLPVAFTVRKTAPAGMGH